MQKKKNNINNNTFPFLQSEAQSIARARAIPGHQRTSAAEESARCRGRARVPSRVRTFVVVDLLLVLSPSILTSLLSSC